MSVPANTIHGEFSSSDASALSDANSKVTLYGPGSGTAVTLDAADWVNVYQLSVSSAGTNLTISVFSGANETPAAGELIWKGVVPTNTTANVTFPVPMPCWKGTPPRVKASGTGQVDVTLSGVVVRQGP